MELDLQSLFELLCTAGLIGRDPATPPLPPHLGSYTRAYWSAKICRRHLFATLWLKSKEKALNTYKVVGNGWASGGPHCDEGVELGGRQVEVCAATAQAYPTTQVVRDQVLQ